MTTDSTKRRRWFQFRLRTLLIVVFMLSLPLSWFAVEMDRARRLRETREAVYSLGGRVLNDPEIEVLKAMACETNAKASINYQFRWESKKLGGIFATGAGKDFKVELGASAKVQIDTDCVVTIGFKGFLGGRLSLPPIGGPLGPKPRIGASVSFGGVYKHCLADSSDDLEGSLQVTPAVALRWGYDLKLVTAFTEVGVAGSLQLWPEFESGAELFVRFAWQYEGWFGFDHRFFRKYSWALGGIEADTPI
jgi:hypothetical protein